MSLLKMRNMPRREVVGGSSQRLEDPETVRVMGGTEGPDCPVLAFLSSDKRRRNTQPEVKKGDMFLQAWMSARGMAS